MTRAATIAPAPAEGAAGAPVESLAPAIPAAAGEASGMRLATAMQTGAALLWIPQAALISMVVGNIAAGAPARAALIPVLGVLLAGIVRAFLERAGARMAFTNARERLSAARSAAAAVAARHSPLDAARPSSGLVASTMAEQAEAIVPYLARFQPLRTKTMAVGLAILCCVAAFSWVAALVLSAAAPLIPLFMALIGWRAQEASERQLSQMGDMNAFLLDRLRGLATIRTFRAVDRTALRLRDNAEDLRRRTMAVLRIAFLSSAVLELFAALGVAMVAVYVGFHLLGELEFGAWRGKLSLAEGLFILLLAPAFFEPLRELASVWHDRAAGRAALDAMARATAGGPEIVGSAEPAASAAGCAGEPASLRIEDLGFRHASGGAPVFQGLTLKIEAGERVAVMAPSGGGKSTLLALVAGLADAGRGSIRIGGEPLNARTAARLRARMAWIGQSPHIFVGTLARNVALGRVEAGSEKVRAALEVTRLAALADRRGSVPVGEEGAGVSGGEALRLAIARVAAWPDADIILVDEPTAHLDRATAEAITDTLLAVTANRTLIVATHDPVLAARMDRVIDLGRTAGEQGR